MTHLYLEQIFREDLPICQEAGGVRTEPGRREQGPCPIYNVPTEGEMDRKQTNVQINI